MMAATAEEAGDTRFRDVLDKLKADPAAVTVSGSLRLQPTRFENRPFSHLLRVAVYEHDSALPRSHLFLKMFKPKAGDESNEKMRLRVVHEFDTLERVQAAMAGLPDIGVVRPVACYPDHLTIVTEEAPGETLLAHLHRHARWVPSAGTLAGLERTMATVGRWVKVFQSAETGPDVSLQRTREYVDHRLKRLIREPRAKFAASDRERVLLHVDALSEKVAASDLRGVLVHADLAIGNILVSGDRITVLDFAMAHSGSRVHDLGRLFMQLDMLGAKPWFRRSTIRRLQHALLGGFDAALSADNPMFRLALLLHRVNNYATVSLRPGPFPANLYDAHARRLHRKWIDRETLLTTAARMGTLP